jgi:Flp pilus assembly CpaE family ATPase
VILLDYTGHPSDFAMMLDDIPRHSIDDALAGSGQADQDLMDSVLASHPRGIRYLASPSHDFDTRGFTEAFARDVITIAQTMADLVVVDTSERLPAAAIGAYAKCDAVLLLTTRDVVRLDATRRMLAQLNDLGVDMDSVKVFVNHTELGAEVADRELETILEGPVAGYIPHDPEGAFNSVNSGRPLVVNHQRRPLSVVLDQIAAAALARWREVPESKAQPKARGLRLFGGKA